MGTMRLFPWDVSALSHTSTTYAKNKSTFCPSPTLPSVPCPSLPCPPPPPRKQASIDFIRHLALLLFCFQLSSANGSHWQEIGRKEEKEAGLLPCTHTAPSLPYCFSTVAAFLSATALATTWLQ